MFLAVQSQFEHVLAALENQDPEQARKAIEVEREINALDRILSRSHTQRLERGECSVGASVVFLDLVANFEKVGDHLTNVAQTVLGPDETIDTAPDMDAVE